MQTFKGTDPAHLSARKQKVLGSLIKEYIKTAGPVGSKTLCRLYGIKSSSATVRNDMAALEEMGYLVKQHASSGRSPTDIAFRYYVNNLLTESDLDPAEKESIRSFYRSGAMNLEDILSQTSRALSQISRHVGLILSPRFESTILENLSLSGLSRNRILAVFEFRSGVIEHRVIKNELNLRESELERISNYLTEAGSGKSPLELRAELIRQKEQALEAYDQLAGKALTLSEQIMDEAPVLNIYIEGQSNLLEQPEFSDTEKMKRFFRLCEEKKIMIRLLDQALASKGIKVIIGNENPHESMKECSVIATAYGGQGRVRGALGVIGPVRLNYAKIIPLVRFTSGLISDIIKTQS